jgi:arylsulfatase A-like enzyme/Tfp pilus assembly protein PilF
MPALWRLLGGVALGIALIGCLLTSSQTLPGPSLILITVDTLRADRVGAYGYAKARTPTMDRLAARAARFEHAVSHSPLTFPAHVSIFTGQYPSAHGARDNGTFVLGDSAVTMAELLRSAGYRTGAFVGSFILDSGYGLDQGFEYYDDEFQSTGSLLDYDLQRQASTVAERAAAWISNVASDKFFVWIHFYDPHAPYLPPVSFQISDDPYDGEVAAADAGIGAVLHAATEARVADRTAVIVTADHGEGLGEHGESEHGLLLYDSVLKVPLIVAVPGLAPRLVRTQVRHVDLMPTVLALAGVPVPHGLPGRDLGPLLRVGDAAPATDGDLVSYAETWYGRLHFGWSELRAVTADGWKYIDAPRPELYDVHRDPGERRNYVDERPQLAQGLAKELSHLAASENEATASVRVPDSESLDRLRSLGYVSGSGDLAGVGPKETERSDPKEMIEVFERYVAALNAGIAELQGGRPRSAVARLRRVVEEHPKSFEAHHYLGYAHAAAGQHREALAEYDRALEILPVYAVAHFNAAKALAALGQGDATRARLARGFALEPRSFYGHMVAGVVAWQLKDNRAAAAAFHRAVELNPSEPRARANLGEACMRLGDYAKARAQYEALVRMKYQPAAAYFNLGVIAEALGEPDAARDAYRRALALDGRLEAARRALAGLR